MTGFFFISWVWFGIPFFPRFLFPFEYFVDAAFFGFLFLSFRFGFCVRTSDGGPFELLPFLGEFDFCSLAVRSVVLLGFVVAFQSVSHLFVMLWVPLFVPALFKEFGAPCLGHPSIVQEEVADVLDGLDHG